MGEKVSHLQYVISEGYLVNLYLLFIAALKLSWNSNSYLMIAYLLRSIPYQTIKFQILFKLKAFADDELETVRIMESCFKWIENFVQKVEIADSQRFLLFPQSFLIHFH